MDISNGEGVGISLFVQGCHKHCKGCFNQETWDFNGGNIWTSEIENSFIELANKEYIKRISILGGEPLSEENIESVYYLIKKLKEKYPQKQVWIYTGYTIEYLYCKHHIDFLNIFHLIDVLIDGEFDIEKQDLDNNSVVWAGSSNQRIIDCKQTLAKKEIVLYSKKK